VTYHFHSRTKTGRVPALQGAAPEAIVELHADDARRLGIADGDTVSVRSRRGEAQGKARLTGIEPGVVFMPFHYGDWDAPGRKSAANRLTISGWDPVSKQPFFKYAAVRVERVSAGDGRRAADPEQIQPGEPRTGRSGTDRDREAVGTASQR
jgi:ferredoxin-nitrate reductase